MGRIGTSAVGYVGLAVESQKGVAVPITDFLHLKGNTIGVAWDVLRGDIYVGDRHTEQIVEILKGKVAGNLVMPVYGTSGAQAFASNFGKEIFHAAVAPVASTGALTNSNGQTIIPAPAGIISASVVGKWTTVGAPPVQELVQIIDIQGTSLVTKQLKSTTPLASGTPVGLPNQHQFTVRNSTDTLAFEAPTLTLETNKGRQWSWLLAGCRIVKSNIKGAKADAEVTHTMVGTVEPAYLGPTAYTVYNPTADERSERRHPFTIRNGFAVVPNFQGGQNSLSAPAAPVPTTATTGGTIAAGTYGVEVSYTNAVGETVASAPGSIATTGTTSTITVPSPPASTGATGWYAYVTQPGGSTYTRQQAAGSPSAIGTALVLTAPPTSSGLTPQVATTTGASLLNEVVGLESWEFDWDNTSVDKDFWNESRVKDNYLGKTKGMIKYTYANAAGAPADYNAYLATENAPPIPFFISLARNAGSPSVPIWFAVGVQVPAMLVTKVDYPDSFTDVMMAHVEADIISPDDGSSPASVFIVNNVTTPYIRAGDIVSYP